MTEGVSADGKQRGRWTDGALAQALDKIDGRRPEHEHAPNAVGKWRKGLSLPESVDGLLAIFFDASDTRKSEREALLQSFKSARLEKFGPILKGGVAAEMPTWKEERSELVIEREPRPSDAKAARDPMSQRLQASIRRAAEKLAADLEARRDRYHNSQLWRALPSVASTLAQIASRKPEELLEWLTDAYDAILYLGGRPPLDDKVRAGGSDDPPLDLDVRGDVEHLVRLAAPWLRGFPSIRRLDDDAAKLLTKLGDIGAARKVARKARDNEVINARDAEEIETLGNAADERVATGEKAARRAVGGANNLVLSLAGIEAARQADAIDPSDEDRLNLARKARATLREAKSEIEQLMQSASDDLRGALRTLIAQADREGEGTPSPVSARPDLEAQAREMVLNGTAPPSEWQPYIRELNFRATKLADARPLAGLTALIKLDLKGTQITDAKPLRGLKLLTMLDLSGTKLIDTSPLSELLALTALSLRATLVADAQPLSKLTSLIALALSMTKISDATSLSEIKTLRMLSLRGTLVANAAPLSCLTTLTRLSLGGTQVADFTPLSGLTALERLSLGATRFSDATLLSELTSLRSLDLSGTQVVDAAPLSRLTKLEFLRLGGTRIADATPLAHLVALKALRLSGSRIDNVAPLLNLTSLTHLHIRGTRVSDLSPLAELIAAGLKVDCDPHLSTQYESLKGRN